MEFYMGRRRDINKGYWISFENHPRLEQTKKNIYVRCLPCLEKLYAQLNENPTVLTLEEPLDCWKIVVVLKEFDECLDLLQAYQDEKFPCPDTVRGRVGTNDKVCGNTVVIFQVGDEKKRDAMLADLQRMAKTITSQCFLYYERGCQDLYVSLCGDWRKWEKTTPIKNPRLIGGLKEKVGRLLKGDYQ